MKTKYLTTIFALGLLAIIGGAYIINSRGVEPEAAAIKFDPNYLDWDSWAPQYWYASIRAGVGSDFPARNINASTIKFEGIVPNIVELNTIYKGALVAVFDGESVFNIISSTIGHMGVPPNAHEWNPIHYYFTVSGALIDGTPIEGEGKITIRFVNGLPPPPA